jgi:hypothetical protein
VSYDDFHGGAVACPYLLTIEDPILEERFGVLEKIA